MYLNVILKRFSVSMACAVLMLSCSMVSLGVSPDDKDGILMDGVAAHVNKHVVTVSEVLAVVASEHRRIAREYTGKELKKRLDESYRQMLNVIVERYLVMDAYVEQGANLPDWVVDRRIEDIVVTNFENNRSKLMETLAADGVTYEEWRKDVLDRIIISTMNSTHVTDNIRVSPGAAKAEYDGNTKKYNKPEEVSLRLIVQDKDSAGVAVKTMSDLLERLKSGEDFGSMAKKFSSGNKAVDGGLWDWVEPKMLRNELVNAISNLKAGEISGLIETKSELYIVKLEDRRKAGVISFAEVQPEIERGLRVKAAEQLYVSWIERLKEGAYVKLFDVELF